ncbi:hypothetical protein ACFFGH_33595 [Lysobacter korlensis]|uniref:Uncharacterized protein n=1 Tax=Lysobacter korlensis TaxID=553636 RepID=A0ABV6S3U5_9GAMM
MVVHQPELDAHRSLRPRDRQPVDFNLHVTERHSRDDVAVAGALAIVPLRIERAKGRDAAKRLRPLSGGLTGGGPQRVAR